MESELTIGPPSLPDSAKYLALAWVTHFGILTLLYTIDYGLRDSEEILSGGIIDSKICTLVFWGSLIAFILMSFIGTRYIRGFVTRELAFLGQVAICLFLTFIWAIYYALGILGDSI